MLSLMVSKCSYFFQTLYNVALANAKLGNWAKAEENLILALSQKGEPRHGTKIEKAMQEILVSLSLVQLCIYYAGSYKVSLFWVTGLTQISSRNFGYLYLLLLLCSIVIYLVKSLTRFYIHILILHLYHAQAVILKVYVSIYEYMCTRVFIFVFLGYIFHIRLP